MPYVGDGGEMRMKVALGELCMHPTPLSRQDRVGSTPLCDVCQFTVKTVESLLENNVTEVSPGAAQGAEGQRGAGASLLCLVPAGATGE